MAPNDKYLKYQLQIKFIFDICGYKFTMVKFKKAKALGTSVWIPIWSQLEPKKKNDMDFIVYQVSFYHPHLMIWII